MTLLAPGSRRAGGRAGRQIPRARSGAAPSITLASPSTTGRADPSPRALGPIGAVVALLLLALAVVVQRTALPLLPGGPADLVTVLVVVLGLSFGPALGCSYGFAAGLLADLLSDHTLGRLAAVLCVIGYAAGLVPARGRRLRVAVPLVAVGCALVPLLFGLTGAFVGDTRASGALLGARCIAGAGYGLLLGLICLPLVPRLVAPRRALRAGRRTIIRLPG